MGNKGSFIFGGGAQVDSPEESRESAPQTEEQKAEALRYSELFGGKPKARAKGNLSSAADGEHRPTHAKPHSSRKKNGGSKKKKRRGNGGGRGGFESADQQQQQQRQLEEEDVGVSGGEYTDCETGDSEPMSPVVQKPAATSQATSVAMTEPERKKLLEAVTAKIEHLQKENEQGAVSADADKKGQYQHVRSMVRSKGATKAARARAAVTNALYAGADPVPPKELLVSCGGGGWVEGAAGAGSGGVAAMPAKHTSPRPGPQRNFKAKV